MSMAYLLRQSIRFLGYGIFVATILFLLQTYLIVWLGWPGPSKLFSTLPTSSTASESLLPAWILLLSIPVALFAVLLFICYSPKRNLLQESAVMAECAAYIARTAFWAVLLIGLTDMVISMLRVEGILPRIVGQELNDQLGRPQFRGLYVHNPLIICSLIIGYRNRSISFVWLAFLVVLAEFQIVIARFIFSYEQAFMGDLVRFWYAALFLFASAYTLAHEGHVRVDVFYAQFSEHSKALANFYGSLLLGIPLCWIILTRGMWSKTSIINAPLLNFEISQSGYGLYVKYQMAGFLLIYAVSMMFQFISNLFSSGDKILHDSQVNTSSGKK